MVVTRNNCRIGFLDIGDYKFEKMDNFKYLTVDANNHENIKIRLAAVNRRYLELVPLFKSKVLSCKSEITLYKVLVRPVALYACGAWATTKSDELKLAIIERKNLWT